MLLFGTSRLLKSFLGASWRFLAHFDPKMGPEMDPKKIKKSDKNLSKNLSTFEPH